MVRKKEISEKKIMNKISKKKLPTDLIKYFLKNTFLIRLKGL